MPIGRGGHFGGAATGSGGMHGTICHPLSEGRRWICVATGSGGMYGTICMASGCMSDDLRAKGAGSSSCNFDTNFSTSSASAMVAWLKRISHYIIAGILCATLAYHCYYSIAVSKHLRFALASVSMYTFENPSRIHAPTSSACTSRSPPPAMTHLFTALRPTKAYASPLLRIHCSFCIVHISYAYIHLSMLRALTNTWGRITPLGATSASSSYKLKVRAKTIACHKSIYNNHDKFVVL